MNKPKLSFTLVAALLFAAGVFTGCESTDGGSPRASSGTYYSSGYNDPWYHGQNDFINVVVTPPPSGNRPDQGLHPAHPIAPPPQVSRPAPPPMPSIPSTPRPAMRR